MRVLLHQAGTGWSGHARVLADFARQLVQKGARVVLTCPPDSIAEQRFGAIADVTVRTVEGDGGWLEESRRLRHVLRELFSEVVIVHTAHEHLVAAAALRMADRGAVLRRIPTGGTLTGGRTERTAAFLAAGGFIVSTEEELQSLALPRRQLRPSVVPLGIDPVVHDQQEPSSYATLGVSPDNILLVCAMDAASRQRVATVLRTLALLAAGHPSLYLAIIGPGADHEDLRMHAAALGVIHRVAFLGERDDHLAVMRAADVGWVVACDDAEAYGLLDFMAMGVPVVAERGHIAARYVADGITGTLLPASDAPASAAALATLLSDDAVRTTMGRAGRLRAGRDFGDGVMAEALVAAVGVARDRSKWRSGR